MGNSISMGPVPSPTTAFLTFSDPKFGSDAGTFSGDDRFSKNPTAAIRIESFDYEIHQIGSECAGRPRSIESVEHGDFNVTRYADPMSPYFFRLVARAEFVSEANLMVFSEYPRQTTPYLVFHMSWLHVSSYSISYDDGGFPVERISLKYGNLRVVGRGHVAKSMYYTPNTYGTCADESFSQILNIPVGMATLFTAPLADGDSLP